MSNHYSNVETLRAVENLQGSMDGALLEAVNLNKTVQKGDNHLRDISLSAHSGEVIALISLNAGDSALLLEVLAGRSQPSGGQVSVAGEDLYKNLRNFRGNIGFVPRGEIVHPDLTVFEAINYAAGLRMPAGTDRRMRRTRVEEVINTLELTQLRKKRVKSLDPEQRKRVSIGAELITNPILLFLDEPFLDLNPAYEARLLHTLHTLADQGRAILLSTQSVLSTLQADRTAILLPGGYQGWFGPAAEAITFFNSFGLRQDLDGKKTGLAEALNWIGSAGESDITEWAQRYHAHPAYKKYLAGAPKDKQQGIMLEDRPLARRRAKEIAAKTEPKLYRVPGLRQFITLSARALKLISRDRAAILLILVAPWLAAGLDLLFSSRSSYDFIFGSSEQIIFSLALLACLVMLLAGISWTREIQKETGIIRHERQASLKLIPYLLSKVWIVLLAALYQAAVWTGAHFFLSGIQAGSDVLLYFYLTLALVAMIGGLLGLLASGLTRTWAGANLVVFIVVLLQLFFSGGLRQIPGISQSVAGLKWMIPSRLATEALVTANGYGKALANDICLRITEAERQAEAQKGNCTCVGIQLFSKCRFPGVGRYYVTELGQAGPEGFPQGPPSLPTPPDMTIQMSAEEHLNDFIEYGRKLESNWLSLNRYFSEQADWELKRNLAVISAESLIKGEYDYFGQGFNVNLPRHWAALAGAATILLLILAVTLRTRGLQP